MNGHHANARLTRRGMAVQIGWLASCEDINNWRFRLRRCFRLGTRSGNFGGELRRHSRHAGDDIVAKLMDQHDRSEQQDDPHIGPLKQPFHDWSPV